MKKVKRKKKIDERNSRKPSFQLWPSLPKEEGGMSSCSVGACVWGWRDALSAHGAGTGQALFQWVALPSGEGPAAPRAGDGSA